MNAEQPDYSKLPKQFQLGLKAGADIQDGRQAVAYLIELVNLLNGRLIEEVEERTRWRDLSLKQNERIAELVEEVVKGAEAVVELKKRLRLL
jgi:hypothetical protein